MGDFGGRVNQLTLTGTGGSVSVTGSAFAAAFNLRSTWFSLADQPSGGVGGYWIDDNKGGIFTFGDAQFYGSTGNIALNKPIVGMAATPDGKGYWLVASDGGIFTFGDAAFYGSTGATAQQTDRGHGGHPRRQGLLAGGVRRRRLHLRRRRVLRLHGRHRAQQARSSGMAPTPDGKGYWLVASDGGIFSFGDATFYGSLGASPPSSPVVGVAPAAGGTGYWMLEADGTVKAFGSAQTLPPAASSPAMASARSPMTAIIPSADGQGYALVDSSGQAFTFGDAPYFGDVASAVPGYSGRVVGIAASPG